MSCEDSLSHQHFSFALSSYANKPEDTLFRTTSRLYYTALLALKNETSTMTAAVATTLHLQPIDISYTRANVPRLRGYALFIFLLRFFAISFFHVMCFFETALISDEITYAMEKRRLAGYAVPHIACASDKEPRARVACVVLTSRFSFRV